MKIFIGIGLFGWLFLFAEVTKDKNKSEVSLLDFAGSGVISFAISAFCYWLFS